VLDLVSVIEADITGSIVDDTLGVRETDPVDERSSEDERDEDTSSVPLRLFVAVLVSLLVSVRRSVGVRVGFSLVVAETVDERLLDAVRLPFHVSVGEYTEVLEQVADVVCEVDRE
jgi:hypothetical protein